MVLYLVVFTMLVGALHTDAFLMTKGRIAIMPTIESVNLWILHYESVSMSASTKAVGERVQHFSQIMI